jgi:N-acetylglucosaminyl-diphospho-decaprenol L-rhamnosyltransferase
MRSSDPQFSAIVVTFHTGPVLDECLKALNDASLCRQIVLVNNGIRPDVLAALLVRAQSESKLTILDGHGNIGFGRACNLGAESAREDKLIFVNPDCVVDDHTLPAFAEALACFPVALIGGSLRNEDGTEQRGARRGELTPWSALVSFIGFGKSGEFAGIWRDFNRFGEPIPTEIVDMPVISGALMAVAKSTFQQVGGFDPGFFLHVEDIDLCRRLRENGGLVKFAPSATALHIGATSDVSSWDVEKSKIASFARYFWKNARGIGGYVSVVLLMPMLSLAIILRLILKKTRVETPGS